MSDSALPTSTPATPMAGAVTPRSWSELGTIGDVAPSFEPAEPAEPATEQPAPPPNTEEPAEQATEQQEPEQTGELTPELRAAKYDEWMQSDTIPEEFGDKVLWYDSDGKGEMLPIRLKDIPQNILLYRDYQHKTTQLAQERREHEGRVNGFNRWREDMRSGNPAQQQMALRAIGADIRQLVVGFVQQEAELEQYPEHMRERMREALYLDEKKALFNRQLQLQQQEQQQRQQQEQQQQGTEAPDVVYVQDRINEMLPAAVQQCGVIPSEAFYRELDAVMSEAAAGVRGPNGQYITPPSLIRGRAPSPQMMERFVRTANERLQLLLAQHGRRVNPPKKTAPPALSGSGPAAKPGQRGNISSPERRSFDDM